MEQKPPTKKPQPSSTAGGSGHWITESEETLFNSHSMKMVLEECRSSLDAEKTHKFYTLRSRDWCNIIPVTEDGKIVLVRQFRIGAHTHTLEFPGGVVDHDEEDHAQTALRELTEETGYTPLPEARCIHLGSSLTNPAIFDNTIHSFIVGPVRRTQPQNLDPGEMIEVVEVPIDEIPSMVEAGDISHALMLITFFHLTMKKPSARAELTEALRTFSG